MITKDELAEAIAIAVMRMKLDDKYVRISLQPREALAVAETLEDALKMFGYIIQKMGETDATT